MAKYKFQELVIDSRTGLNPRKNFTLGRGNNHYITIKDIHDGKIEITNKTDRVDDDAIAIIKKRSRIKNGDILFTSIGRIGETAIVTEKDDTWDVNESVFVFTLNTDIITQEYFCELFQSNDVQEKLLKNSSGSTFKSIKMNQLEKMVFNIPRIDEQIRVTEVLGKIKELISFSKQQLEKLDELAKARFVELFGDPEHNEKKWDVFKLDALCSVSSSKRIYQNELSVEGVPFLRISDLVNRMDTGSTECELYIPEERYEELKTLGLVPIAGDMLITARGTLGRCYTLTENDRFYFQDGMITWLYDFDKSLTTNYLTHLFAMSGFRKQIDSLQAGSTVAYLSISMTKKLNVMLPPLELQNQFTAFVEQTDKSKLTVQQSLDKLEVLKKSLMQQYFG